MREHIRIDEKSFELFGNRFLTSEVPDKEFPDAGMPSLAR